MSENKNNECNESIEPSLDLERPETSVPAAASIDQDPIDQAPIDQAPIADTAQQLKGVIPPASPVQSVPRTGSFHNSPFSAVPPVSTAYPIAQPAPGTSRGGWSAPFFSGCLMGCSGCSIPFLLFLIFCTVLGMSMETSLTRTVISGPSTPMQSANPKIAVIHIDETIMEDNGFIAAQIDDVSNDSTIKGIVLRMNTPGGSVSTSDLFYHRLTQLRKECDIPIVVSMGGMCASGGYYIAMACGTENEDVIFAEPTTWTGSIGVIINNYDLSELAEKVGIKEDPIKSHELKGMGSLTRPMTEKERALFQRLVDTAFSRFKEVVYSGRKKFADDPNSLTPLATGEVFTTQEALENGLVDREGYLEDAVDRAIELAGLPKETTQVFIYEEKQTFSDVMSAAQKKLVRSQADEVREMAVPRASYLWQADN